MAYFNKEQFIDILNAKAEMAQGTPSEVFYKVVQMLEKLPAADVVETPCKCEKCIYAEIIVCPITGAEALFCQYGTRPVAVDPAHYCGYGERRKV